MLKFFKSLFGVKEKYANHPEAVIISCFYNFQNSQYRIDAFNKWYKTIKHLNHRITECILEGNKSQLPDSPFIDKIYTKSKLWPKEQLLNQIIQKLPLEFNYVFWIDSDVLFTNNNWLVDSVNLMKRGIRILQPFTYCVHLNEGELVPDFAVEDWKGLMSNGQICREKQMWRSFGSNITNGRYKDKDYDVHGHVGFAWGATRELLSYCLLYDKALIGGADHIIAHAAMGQIPCNCITNSFTDNIDEVNIWSRKFYAYANGKVGSVEGDLYHLWHGHLKKRAYLKRIQEFTVMSKKITQKDKNGLYITDDTAINSYMDNYLLQREVGMISSDILFNSGNNLPVQDNQFQGFGGGDSGGAGAGGSWNDNTPNTNPGFDVTDALHAGAAQNFNEQDQRSDNFSQNDNSQNFS